MDDNTVLEMDERERATAKRLLGMDKPEVELTNKALELNLMAMRFVKMASAISRTAPSTEQRAKIINGYMGSDLKVENRSKY